MNMQMPYYPEQLCVLDEDKETIEETVTQYLRKYSATHEDLQVMAIECASSISNNMAISSELAEQGPFKRLWNSITGKNQRMSAILNHNTANVQYTQQQILIQLISQNADTLGLIAKIDKENHAIFLEIEDEQLKTNRRLEQLCMYLIDQQKAIGTISQAQEKLSGELDRVMFVCPHCHAITSRNVHICHVCSSVIHKESAELVTGPGKDKFGQDLQNLAAQLQEISQVERVFSKTRYEKYNRCIRRVERFTENVTLPASIRESIKAKCTHFKNILDQQHIEIAIAGTVKAGKSSLINALLDMEFATVNATPETSVLAKYRTTGGENYLKVQFYSPEQWDQIQKEAKESLVYQKEYSQLHAEAEKKRWVGHENIFKKGLSTSDLQKELNGFISSKAPAHFFVKEVEVGIHSDFFPHDVYLVDTPGLDDPVKTRSNVTKVYLDKADAVLACVKEKDIHKASEAKFITRVMANRGNWGTIFVLATQKDLDTPADCAKSQRYFVSNILTPMFYPRPDKKVLPEDVQRVKRQFFGISAKLYNYTLAMEAGTINEKDQLDYTGTLIKNGLLPLSETQNLMLHLDEVKKYSEIPQLKDNLKKRVFKQARHIMYEKAEASYQGFLRQIVNISKDAQEAQNARMNILNSNAADLSEQRKKVETAQQFVATLENQINAISKQAGGRK